ncbi:hypothetical protein KP509_03G050900 [Ceratopteris richardii]|uniref:SBP-type domain-containing protein n=1 Tax=Ceratopteris richardii TaxID=49495 RepID=A0A8T2UZR5_CERRI|nr:hypothetical protein KP509_03G050900 [Ceratopteris richardii]
MEKVEGLPYRGNDGPSIQLYPVQRQHDFYQTQACNIVAQNGRSVARPPNSMDDASNLNILPMPWHATQLDPHNVDTSGARNWSQSWEWDSLSLTGRAATNGHGVHNYSQQWGGVETDFSSPSPPDNSEENVLIREPTLLEFGLNRRTRAASEEDGLLDLRLGGNGQVSGAGESSPNSKRSRHSPSETHQIRCQVDNCAADLQNAKDYHRRHKVCEVHAKAPKALVGTVMQRFCQQCSRFHSLKEFDDDRRSCRKRLAGHNRRRRKSQPDATTALACLLADQTMLSRIIGPSGHDQDELDKILQERTLLQTILNSRAAVGNSDGNNSDIMTQNLMSTISKSQLLTNLLLSNSLGCNIPTTPAPADALISALSTALLASLPQLHKVNSDAGHGSNVSTQEMTQLQEPYANMPSSHQTTKVHAFPRYSPKEQPGPRTFPSASDRPLQLPTTPPVHSDKSNNSIGDSLDERFSRDPCQKSVREGVAQHDSRQRISQKNESSFAYSNGNSQTAHIRDKRCQALATRTSSQAEQFETAINLSDHSSDSGFDRQEQTGSLWFKIFDKNPADIPSNMRSRILKWLDHRPIDVEGHIKPGCIILSIFLCMPIYIWEKICGNIEKSLQELVSISDDDFWRKGRVLAHFGGASAFIVDGEVFSVKNHSPLQIPRLLLVQPSALAVGETVALSVRGQNLKVAGTKFACAFQGKCVIKDLDVMSDARNKEREKDTMPGFLSPDAFEEQTFTFTVGPFDNIGRGFVEVEGQLWRGSALPIIVAEKSMCQEINLLQGKFIESSCNKAMPGIDYEQSNAAIVHFLHELGWLLQRVQHKDHYSHLSMPEFSSRRYRWLLRFAVEHNCCAVVKWALDILFSTDGSTAHQAYSRALNVISESNLLHLAVKNKLCDMVTFLIAYSPTKASSTESKREFLFRPDTPIYGGFTPLHLAASMQSAENVLDALTNAPAEIWATAWVSAEDASGKTPLMYAITSCKNESVIMVQRKLQKLGRMTLCQKEMMKGAKPPPFLILNIDGEEGKHPTAFSSGKVLPIESKQVCTCRARDIRLAQSSPLRIRGLNKGFMQRPFLVSMLAVAAVCVCVGVLMRGSPTINSMQGPFVWESISFGSI